MFPESNFLQEVLLSWVNVINTDVSNNEYVGKQIIWNNKNIQINKKSIIYKNWFNKGIKYIEHIYDFRKKEFYKFTKLSEIYQVPSIDYLKYNQLVSSISKKWKTKLKTENITYIKKPSILDNILKHDHVNRLIYTYQLKNEKTTRYKSTSEVGARLKQT